MDKSWITATKAGNISRYLNNWLQITNDNFVLKIVSEGYKIQFINNPVFPQSIISSCSCPLKANAIQTQIDAYLSSSAISVIPPCSNILLSRIFLVKKANGKDRLIIDLSQLNLQINKVSFKMETHEHITNLIELSDFMASIDLSDAFFSIPVHKDYKKYLCFQFNNIIYQFNVLPFGLTSSPRIFSKVLKPVIKHLRKLCIKISFYLDDIFLCHSSATILQEQLSLTLNLLSSLGYSPNYSKSHLTPSRSLKHLGFTWNSALMQLSVPEDKVSKIKSFASTLLSCDPSLRNISSFLGTANSLSPAFPYAPLYFRKLQIFHSLLVKSKLPWNSKISLSQDSKSDLEWWSSCSFPLRPASLTSSLPDFTLSTDASLSGWGGVLSSGQHVSGSWSSEEASCHINLLELTAVYFSFLSFLSILKNSHVLILSDNFTTVSFINRKGGTHSQKLCSISLSLWELLLKNNITCQASHIAGKLNVNADFLSRKVFSSNEYSISSFAFTKLLSLLPFSPSMDLFASRLNAKLNKYCSWKHDPFAFQVNAFTFTWPNCTYMFPPINLIPKCINKFINDDVQYSILITPAWSGLISLPLILSKLTNDPIFILHEHLEGPLPTRHPFNLMAWIISNNPALILAYQQKLQNLSSKAFLPPPSPPIVDHGNDFTRSLIKIGHTVHLL